MQSVYLIHQTLVLVNYFISHHIHFVVSFEQVSHITGNKYKYPKGLHTWFGLLYPFILFLQQSLHLALHGDSI